MAGRKLVIAPEDIFEAVKDLSVFDDNNKLKKERDSIWKIGRQNLMHKITPKNLYTRFYNNRNNLLTLVKEHQNRGLRTNFVTENFSVEEKSTHLQVDTIKELQRLRSNVCYYPMFKEICAVPFHIIYWFPDQIDLIKEFKIKKFDWRVNLGLCEDLIKNARVCNYDSGSLVYFFAFSVYNNNILPFVQIISERKSKQFINFFFM